MRLTYNELLATIKCNEIVVRTGKISNNDTFDLKVVIAKLREYGKYVIRYVLDRKKQNEITAVSNEVSEWVKRYYGMRDASLVFEYDTMKKEGLLILDKLATMRATLDAELVIAEEDIRIIRDKIAKELQEEGKVKTATEADKRSRVDTRYERALEDYRVLLKMAYLIRRKYEVMSQASSSVTQSVAMGRVGMVQQSYVANDFNQNNVASGSNIRNATK